MKTAINDIALRELGIVTLKMRLSDDLDFHTLSVWQVQDALTAAYEAGKSSAAEATGTEGDPNFVRRDDVDGESLPVFRVFGI